MLRNGVTKRSSGVKDPLILLVSCPRRPSMYRRRGAGGVTIDFRCSQMKRHAVGHCRHGARAPSGRLKITNEARGDDLDGELDHAACNAARLRCLQYGPPSFSATFPPITRLAATLPRKNTFHEARESLLGVWQTDNRREHFVLMVRTAEEVVLVSPGGDIESRSACYDGVPCPTWAWAHPSTLTCQEAGAPSSAD